MNFEKGKYAIPIEALKKDEDAPSTMADYLSNFAVITKNDGDLTLSLLLFNQQTITGLQVENNEGGFTKAIANHIDEEKNWRYEMFKLTNLPNSLIVRVQYEVDHEGSSFKGDEMLRLSFATDSIERLDEMPAEETSCSK